LVTICPTTPPYAPGFFLLCEATIGTSRISASHFPASTASNAALDEAE
jgi:hypothetical protein